MKLNTIEADFRPKLPSSRVERNNVISITSSKSSLSNIGLTSTEPVTKFRNSNKSSTHLITSEPTNRLQQQKMIARERLYSADNHKKRALTIAQNMINAANTKT